MNPELHQFIERSQYHQGALREVTALLPGDDAELDRLIGEAVKAGLQKEFLFIVMSALEAGRKVDARHLEHGAIMLLDWATLGCVAWHMEGNVPESLIEAHRHSVMPWDMQAISSTENARLQQIRDRREFLATRSTSPSPADISPEPAVDLSASGAGVQPNPDDHSRFFPPSA